MAVRLPGTPLSWLDKEIAEAEEEQLSFRCGEARKSGLYPFDVAADLIARAAGSFVSVAKIRDRLIFAARDRSLPAYELEQTVRWDGDMPIVSCLEVHWDDLNKWLENNEPRIDYKFPKPNTQAAAKVEAVPVTSLSCDDWGVKARAIADRLALERYQRGEREITARNISGAVATELAKDSTTHGIRGERGAGNIRNEALKGWKFIPPTGTNGTSGTKK